MPQFWGKMKLFNQAHSNLENQMQFSQNERWKRSVYSKVIIRSCCTSKCSNRWHDGIRKLVFFYITKLFWVKNQANEDHMLILNNHQWSCWGSVGNICLLHCWFRKCQQNNTCQTLKKSLKRHPVKTNDKSFRNILQPSPLFTLKWVIKIKQLLATGSATKVPTKEEKI